MMRNRGNGILGEAPGHGVSTSMGMKRMMGPTGGAGGESLLGMNPHSAQRGPQQPRSLMDNRPTGRVQMPNMHARESQVGHQPGMRERSAIPGRYMEQPVARAGPLLEDPVYYDQQQGVEVEQYDQQYAEEQYVEPEYVEQQYGVEQQYVEQPYVEEQYQDSRYGQQFAAEQQFQERAYPEQQYVEQTYQEPYVEPEVYNATEEYYEEPVSAESLMEYAEQRHGLGNRKGFRQAKAREDSYQDQAHGGNRNEMRTPQGRNKSAGLLNEPQGAAQRGRSGQQQRLPGTPNRQQKPRTGGMGLLGEHPEARRSMEQEQQQRQPQQQQQQRQHQQQQQNRQQSLHQRQHQNTSQGLLESPIQPPVIPDILKISPRQNIQMPAQRPNTQMELLSKAELQMKLIEQEKIREMEEMNLLQQQQQALLIQQQQNQQQMQIQQQQLMQQQRGVLGMSPQIKNPGANIPSLFDLKTPPVRGGKGPLGKRSGGPNRPMDNKRPRSGPADRSRDRNQPAQRRDRSGGSDRRRSQDSSRDHRNRPSRFSTAGKKRDSPGHKRRDSPSSKSKDRKDSGSQKRDVRGGRGHNGSKDQSSRDKSSNSKPKTTPDTAEKTKSGGETKVEVTMKEEYDPANPTGDVVELKTEDTTVEADQSMVKEEEKETDKVSGEEKTDEKKDKQPETSLTVTINKKGRSVNDADKPSSGKQGQTYKCNVCTVECRDEESFARHMNGQKHKGKMQVLMMTSTHQADLIKARMQAEEHLRSIEGSKNTPPAKKPHESQCNVCDRKYTGAYKDHKVTKEHQARETRSKAGCKVCKVTSFKNFIELTKHLQSNSHYKKLKQEAWPECKLCKQKFKSPRKFVQHCKSQRHSENKRSLKNTEDDKDEDELGDLVTLDTVGYEDDSVAEGDKKDKKEHMEKDATDAVKSSSEDKPVSDSPAAVKTRESSLDAKEDEDIEVPGEYDSSLAVGQKFVVAVSGYFCKLCHKYYNNETAAKVLHCQSQAHYNKLQAMIARSKQAKEESQKASTNQTEVSAQNSQSGETIEEVGGEEMNGDQSQEEDQVEPDVTMDTAMTEIQAVEDSQVETQAQKSTPARRGGTAVRGQRAKRGKRV